MVIKEKITETYTTVERAKIIVLSTFGSFVEWYDFFIAAVAASLVWQFIYFNVFPQLSATFSIAAFGVSYFTRPIGAYLFGHLGDKKGRKYTLILTLVTVGVAMLGISVLPPASSIGLLAPILLFVFRAVQGIGFGGEFGGAASWVLESNSHSKWRGTFTSLTNAALGLGGGTAAALLFYLSSVVPRSSFLDFWWRVPFIIGVIFLFSAALIRYFALESNLFMKLEKEGKVLKSPANFAIRKEIGLMLLVALAWLYAWWINPTLIQIFAPFYLSKFGISSTYVTYTIMVTNFVIVATMTLGGFLSDLIGRKKTVIISAILSAAFIYPYTLLLASYNLFNILIAQVVIYSLATLGSGSLTVYYTELFKTQYRYSASGLSYQFVALYAGILITFGVPYILSSANPLLYVILIGIILSVATIVIISRMKETKDLNISE